MEMLSLPLLLGVQIVPFKSLDSAPFFQLSLYSKYLAFGNLHRDSPLYFHCTAILISLLSRPPTLGTHRCVIALSSDEIVSSVSKV